MPVDIDAKTDVWTGAIGDWAQQEPFAAESKGKAGTVQTANTQKFAVDQKANVILFAIVVSIANPDIEHPGTIRGRVEQ